MKSSLFAAALLLASPAFAADVVMAPIDVAPEETAPVQVAPSSVANWHGFYAGAIAGLVASTGRADLGPIAGVLIPLDVSNGLFARSVSNMKSSFTGGISAGYNFQNGNFVGGAEADISFAHFELRHTRSRIDPNPFPPFTGLVTNSSYETKFGSVATARLRAGYSIKNTLLFATAGLAAAKVTNRISIGLPGLGYASPDWSESKIRYGFAIGAGVEHKVTEKVSVKLEGLYVNLKDTLVTGQDPVTFPGESLSYKFKNDMFIGRVGVNVQF